MGTSGEIFLGKIYSLSIQIWHNIQQSQGIRFVSFFFVAITIIFCSAAAG